MFISLFSVKLSQGLKVSADWEIIEEIYSSSQAISLRIWGLFRRHLLSVTTRPWSHQHFHARSQQLPFSEMTSDYWSLIWRNCYLPVHAYYGAWNQTSKMQTREVTGHLVNTGQGGDVFFRSLACIFSSLHLMDYLQSRAMEPWVNLRCSWSKSRYLDAQPWIREVFSKKSNIHHFYACSLKNFTFKRNCLEKDYHALT